MDMKRIHDDLTEYFILSRFSEVDNPDTAHEINSQRERAILHYKTNTMFHAKVQRDVASVIRIIEGWDEQNKRDAEKLSYLQQQGLLSNTT